MLKNLIWQIGQLFKKFPDPKSWKYRFLTYLYDLKYGVEEETVMEANIKFPAPFNIIFFENKDEDVPNFITKYPKGMVAAMQYLESLSSTMKEFGIEMREVGIKMREVKEIKNDHDERVPEGWEPVYAFDDDPDTLIGLVDPDGRVHDKRDVIYDDPEPTA